MPAKKKIKNKVKGLRTIPVQEFLALEFNQLKDSKRNVNKLVNAIKKGGWAFPVFIWENFVIDGTGRKMALEKLIKEEYEIDAIPVVDIEAKNLKEAKQRALEVSSQYGNVTRDSFLFFAEDLELDFETFDLPGINKDILISPDDKDDEVPGVPTKAESKEGDLYELGEHRVLCGDSTSQNNITKLMGDKLADMLLTDPPYNVDYTGKTKDALKLENDKMEDSTFRTFLVDAYSVANSVMKPGAVFYIWHADSEGYNFRGAAHDIGWKIRQCLIWYKNNMVMGRQDYHWQHEPCLYGWKDGKHLWVSDRKQTTVLSFARPSRSEAHPTMKPVELLSYQLMNNTKEKDLILDTFLGSGSTLIAADKSNRICYGMELDPKYVDVIVQRYVDYTEGGKVIKNGKEIHWEMSEVQEEG